MRVFVNQQFGRCCRYYAMNGWVSYGKGLPYDLSTGISETLNVTYVLHSQAARNTRVDVDVRLLLLRRVLQFGAYLTELVDLAPVTPVILWLALSLI
jgi:hypothetical protein